MREIGLLLKKADRYIKSAKLLLENEDTGSSVSRSYYAMFYAAQAILLTKNIRASSHKGIVSSFGEHFIKTGIFEKRFGREISNAFKERQIGDYDFELVIDKGRAEELLDKAEEFVDVIKEYLKSTGL